ncbi:hypothetical protein AGMMS50239_26860 [Bacteroidia bacterium]|nr:hypothetical protein AGMMS50239_26860 [Bacteroidia bacterium]
MYICVMEEMITIPRKEYERMKAQIAELTELVVRLTEEIALLKNGRNSKASSTASSLDIGRSNTISLCGKRTKKREVKRDIPATTHLLCRKL